MDGVTLEVGLEGQEEQAKWVKKEKGLQAESSVCTTTWTLSSGTNGDREIRQFRRVGSRFHMRGSGHVAAGWGMFEQLLDGLTSKITLKH